MHGHRAARWVLLAQATVTVASATIWLLGVGPQAGLAAAAGGLIALVPALYMAVRVFSVPPDAEPKRLLSALYRGEATKFLLTAALFALAVNWFGAVFLPVIATYILALLVYWLALYRSAVAQG